MSDKSKNNNILMITLLIVGLLILFAITITGTVFLVSKSSNQEVHNTNSKSEEINDTNEGQSNIKVNDDNTISKSEDGGGVHFDNISFDHSYGTLKMIGEVTSERQSEISFLFTVSLYDENGTLLNTFPGSVRNLQAGETKTFTAMSTYGESFDNYNIQIDGAY